MKKNKKKSRNRRRLRTKMSRRRRRRRRRRNRRKRWRRRRAEIGEGWEQEWAGEGEEIGSQSGGEEIWLTVQSFSFSLQYFITFRSKQVISVQDLNSYWRDLWRQTSVQLECLSVRSWLYWYLVTKYMRQQDRENCNLYLRFLDEMFAVTQKHRSRFKIFGVDLEIFVDISWISSVATTQGHPTRN